MVVLGRTPMLFTKPPAQEGVVQISPVQNKKLRLSTPSKRNQNKSLSFYVAVIRTFSEEERPDCQNDVRSQVPLNEPGLVYVLLLASDMERAM